jgi:flagella basal body P-ring formation protein FlgA
MKTTVKKSAFGKNAALGKIAALGLTGFLAFTLPAADAEAARLKSDVIVSGSQITLGDIFDEAGAAGSVVIAESPVPGLTDTLSVSRISAVARRNGLDWRNRDGLTHIAVKRTGLPVGTEEVRSVLAEALTSRFPAISGAGVLEVEIAPNSAPILVAEGEFPSVSVDRYSVDAGSGRFVALLRAPANDPAAPVRRVMGRAYPALDVPVLTNQKSGGELIRASDIEWVRVPLTRLGQNMITDMNKLIGMTPRNGIRPGRPIRASDVETPVVVEKSSLVNVTFRSGAMLLSTRGTALNAGAVGETISILNSRSRRTIQAVVTGPGEAEITAPDPVRLVSAQ